jgi:hypothetical protein
VQAKVRPRLHSGNRKSRPQLEIVYQRVEALKPDSANPRIHSKKQIRQIANSIEAFGFNVPILIDRAGQVIAGHGRLLACRELGWQEVPTLCLDHLTAAQARAFMITDNRLTEIAAWDDRLLAEHLKDLSLLGLDFSLELTGFDMGEIDLRIASLEDQLDPADDPADAVPELPTRPLSKLGDLWLLGSHRVLCGNALDPMTVAALMDDEPADMVPTRPTMCRSMVMRAASVPSITVHFQWLRGRWTKRRSPLFSARLAGTSQPSARTARSTSSAWIGGISMSC